MIPIELSEADAILFRTFRVNQDIFQELADAGAFGSMESGKIIININANKIQNIVVEKRIFTRRA